LFTTEAQRSQRKTKQGFSHILNPNSLSVKLREMPAVEFYFSLVISVFSVTLW